MKPIFGDMEIIEKHHNANRIASGELESFEGRISHYSGYGKDIKFECLICGKEKIISLEGENSKTECCGITYNKKFKYGRDIYPTIENKLC